MKQGSPNIHCEHLKPLIPKYVINIGLVFEIVGFIWWVGLLVAFSICDRFNLGANILSILHIAAPLSILFYLAKYDSCEKKSFHEVSTLSIAAWFWPSMGAVITDIFSMVGSIFYYQDIKNELIVSESGCNLMILSIISIIFSIFLLLLSITESITLLIIYVQSIEYNQHEKVTKHTINRLRKYNPHNSNY